jgi:co-chaperonin GroES (HSP10)
MKAIGNYIILKEILEQSKKTAGGLELAEKHREDIRYRQGRVISSGPSQLEKDQVILFDRVAGHQIEQGNDIYKVIMLRDVVAIV